ncbi:HET-s domain-containing [Lecanosticta acicola]|uniref:HET-s domain-containing n=1 Tax=Lecanosticta acicola TaxID=111012 RepID=A0AAI8Z0Q5_9PEZI|nr:HET-s domain-containing [Lecanosticta acicola]
MEAYRHAHQAHNRTRHLTKLYSDAKKSALTNLQVQSAANAQFASLHRKYRIQKDRLITWGLEWSDGEKGPDGAIDDAVAKAGLTETVESVMRNIQEVFDESERMKAASVTPMIKPGEKIPQQPVEFDAARYQDLLHDLTTSIDTLYDLSQNRRALARGEHPTFEDPLTEEAALSDHVEEASVGKKKEIPRKSVLRTPSYASYASSEMTLVNPTFARPSLSPYAGLPARIEVSALRLPNEGPPPYEAIGVPSTTRMVALLARRNISESVQNALGSPAPEVPVLVEYANFDAAYRATGVPPPLQRLEALAACFQPMRADSQTNLSLLGYFEDAIQPRIGLVYDLPYSIQNRLQAGSRSEPLVPLSLLKLVQKANKSQNAGPEVPPPALEHRFRMALRLTEQLHSLHSRELAHGNINSSSIIFTTTANEPEPSRIEALRKPLWASFDLFSKCTIEGVRRATDFNIYRHPHDESNSVNRDFPTDMKYDFYGLGLVLLEVGLWTPISELYKSKYTLPDFKLRLEKIWIPKLAAKCGSAYMRAVETCLRLSDDTDSSRLTVEGIYGILLQFLKRCCLLDDVGSSTELIPASELTFAPNSPVLSSFRSRRRFLPTPERSSLARHQTDPSDFLRNESISTNASAVAAQRMSWLPTIPAGVASTAAAPLSRTVAKESATQVRDHLKERLQSTNSPSLRDFKRRVRILQQAWRERCAAKKERSKMASDQARMGSDNLRTSRSKPKREEFPDVKLPEDILAHWQSTMCFQLQRLVEKALKGSPETSSIRLLPYGESPETAKPTLMVGCTSTAKVKHALKRHFKYDANVYDVRVRKEVIRRCRRGRRHRESDVSRSTAPMHDPSAEKAANPDYQERPLCGASIGAFRYEEHLPPVSFGGVIMVDGRPYGMSVHHMLEPEEESDDEEGQADAGADDDSETSSLGGGSDDDGLSDEDDLSTVRPPSTHSSDDEPAPMSDTAGDCPGILPGDMEEIAITQPALDDAIDCNLHAEEDDEDEDDSGIDEDHLLSFKLGQVHASSGLRRTVKSHDGGFKSISQSLPQEIDWALFELLPPRVHPYNIIKGGMKHCAAAGDRRGNSVPVAVKSSSDLACAKVHCLGRTSGLGSGTVSTTMELVKIHGRSTFSASWTVAGNFGIGGDSGAWVISNEDGKVCGHVLASKTGRTYICPMDLLLEDIRATLGAEDVTLPVVRAGSRPGSSKSEERVVEDAVKRIRIQEAEHCVGGGVALPASPVRASTHRTVDPVG